MLEDLLSYQSWYNELTKEEKARYTNDLRFNRLPQDQKQGLKNLFKQYLNKGVSWGCGSCYLDAHILLLKLNETDMKRIESTKDYEVYPGTFLVDPINKDFNRILTPQSLTEELALYHLCYNKIAPKYFSKVPDNLEDRIKSFLSSQDSGLAKQVQQDITRRKTLLNTAIAQARQTLDIANTAQKEAADKYNKLVEELNSIPDIEEVKEPSEEVKNEVVENATIEQPTESIPDIEEVKEPAKRGRKPKS